MHRDRKFGSVGIFCIISLCLITARVGAQEIGAEASADVEVSIDGEDAETSGESILDIDEEPPAAEEENDRSKLNSWEMGAYRHHSNLKGSTGLLGITEAGSDEAGTIGLGLHGAYFKYSDYIIYGDENRYSWGNANLRITPVDFLEIYAGISSMSNYNDQENPRLFQAIGDVNLGLKGYYSFVPWFTLGLDVEAEFLNGVGDIAFDFAGTSVGINLLGSFDFTEINAKLPLRAHLNVGYVFDNSAKLIEDLEAANGGCGEDSGGNMEYEGCLSIVERTALGINRNDAFRLGIGLDSALPYVSPILEYRIDIPVNRQGFNCPENIPDSPDSCMASETSGAFPQVLTAGVRILPPIESLAIDLGVDIGLSGYSPAVHELAATAPYRILFGLSYSFDPIPEPAPEPVPCPECPPLVIPPGEVAGFVHDSQAVNTPVRGASIEYIGQELNPQISSNDGRFRSYGLSEGLNTIAVSAEGYESATFNVEVPVTGSVELDCPLKALPKKTSIGVRIANEDGKILPNVTITLEGPENSTMTTGKKGIAVQDVEPGQYKIFVNHEGYLRRQVTVNATPAGTKVESNILLRKRPTKSLVVVKKKRIVIRKKIHFETNSDVISSDSFALLDSIADTLLEHKELMKVEIQGHTDNRGKKAYNKELSDRRARSVRRYLVEAGVDESKLQAKGMGQVKPIAPNVTGKGRARNRRVEFHILEKAQ